VISKEGYYTFAAICADQDGNSLDLFFTINVQPLSYDYSANYLVPVQNTFPYDAKAVDEVDSDATINAAQKMKIFNEASKALDGAKNDVQITASNVDQATTQVLVVEKLKKLISDQVGR
jgi:hypothetical protein